MIIDINEHKYKQFHDVAEKLKQYPELYLDFDSVADFFKAPFLAEFPEGTTWSATGLDDGAEQFDAVIQFKACKIRISKTEQISVDIPDDSSHHSNRKP